MPKSVPQITNGPEACRSLYPWRPRRTGSCSSPARWRSIRSPTTTSLAIRAAEAERVMTNIGLILGDAGLTYDDIVKTTIFLRTSQTSRCRQ